LESKGNLLTCTHKTIWIGVGRCGVDMVRWGYGGDERCGCGELQTRNNFLICGQNPVLCDRLDLVNATWKAVAVARGCRGPGGFKFQVFTVSGAGLQEND